MTRARRLFLGFSGALLLAATSFALGASAQGTECVRTWPEARYVPYGYDHIVHVRNDCRTQAYCDVATDVNPSPIHVAVNPGEQAEVITMRASPAREFTPQVSCRFNAAQGAGACLQ